MASVPATPKIYHITHVQNLSKIIHAGGIWSDSKRIELGIDSELIGMSSIKQRRLEELEVTCHPGTKVGDYVPFYFCPRSIMLYILHIGNHPELTYHEGQGPIVHLVADVCSTAAWATTAGKRWAFSDSNAGARYTSFFKDLGQLENVDWESVGATDFRNPVVKDGKQAEFLLHEFFPWDRVEAIGVHDGTTQALVKAALAGQAIPPVAIQPTWYF